MSIEQFLPNQQLTSNKPSFLERVKNKLGFKEKGPVNREFYNDDKTKKFVFDEIGFGSEMTQLNVRLLFKIDDGWSNIMSVMTRWSDKQEQIFGLEVDVLTENKSWPWKTFYFDYQLGGLKAKTGLHGASMTKTSDEERQIAESLGFSYANQLPQYIDFEKTAKELLLQAKRLDFSPPVLYPKELVK